MPKGPQGQKRKADVIGNAVLIGRIATGEVEDKKTTKSEKAVARGKAGGAKGAAARAARLTAEQKAEIARVAATARWKKS